MAFSPHRVLLKTFNDPWEAYLLQGRLGAEGIAACVFDDHFVYVKWPIATALGGIRVMVPTHLADGAQAVWEGVVDGTHQATLAKLFGDIGEGRCPACGGTAIRYRPTAGEIVFGLAILALFGVPVKLSQRRCTCRTCGTRRREA
jgi:hypothetical protein